jgi:imidazolonepropionase
MPAAPAVVLTGAGVVPCDDAAAPDRVHRDTSLVLRAGRIAWLGPRAALPAEHAALPQEDLGGRLLTPGLIDCHTHLVHAGERSAEWAARLAGASYTALARAGGGILSTVRTTRAADDTTLLAATLPRLDGLLADGVTHVEVKSGYGLDADTELRLLRVARTLPQHRAVGVTSSFLGAHSVPPEYAGRADAYLDAVVLPTLHAAHAAGLVDRVDAFCEGIAFTPAQVARLFDAARALGLARTLHAEQLSWSGGTALAARYGAASADHLEHATDADAAALAAAGTVAVLLPGAYYVLRDTQRPPVAAFRAHRVPMAVATDCNPGTSPLTSLRLAMHLACTLFDLTPAEALAGVTVHAARALGLADAGRLVPGARADLAAWDVDTPAELVYRLGASPLHRRWVAGSPA